ncbi:MAG: hypothetical protein LBH42_08690 [Treponema sp.]|jgi:diaminopimelate epimerase|nr:hypothetical protein [Treponema sp.]
MKILVADPAKNITVFVLEPVANPEERVVLNRAILAEKGFMAEQVGFVISPGDSSGLWRLEMAGGEFCGNAARSFGLYVAGKQGLGGQTEVSVSVSGADKPVRVKVDVEKSRAAAEMPKPVAVDTLDYGERSLPVVVFEGITHIIAPDMEAQSETFYIIKSLLENRLGRPAALGVMFYDTASRFMVPIVYVSSIDTMYFESSCGSGSAALGVWLSRDLSDGAADYAITQPGGVIETEVFKKAGEVISVTIGGEVKLGEVREFFPRDSNSLC